MLPFIGTETQSLFSISSQKKEKQLSNYPRFLLLKAMKSLVQPVQRKRSQALTCQRKMISQHCRNDSRIWRNARAYCAQLSSNFLYFCYHCIIELALHRHMRLVWVGVFPRNLELWRWCCLYFSLCSFVSLARPFISHSRQFGVCWHLRHASMIQLAFSWLSYTFA